ATFFCNNTVCTPAQAKGAACSANRQCASNFCVDNNCCESACASQCAACNVLGMEGTCLTAPKGPPLGGRPACASDGTACGGACGPRSAPARRAGSRPSAPPPSASTASAATAPAPPSAPRAT